MNLTLLDLFLLLMLVISYGLGYRRGFVWQLAAIGSLIVGHVAARYIMPHLEDFGVPDYGLYHFGSWVGIYAVAAIAVYLVAWRFRAYLQKKDLSDLDKHLGGLLGGMKGSLFISLITLLVITVSQGARDKLLESQSGPVVAHIAKFFDDFVPTETLSALEPFYQTPEERAIAAKTRAAATPTSTTADKDEKLYDLPPWFDEIAAEARKTKQRARERRREARKAREAFETPEVQEKLKKLRDLRKQIREERKKTDGETPSKTPAPNKPGATPPETGNEGDHESLFTPFQSDKALGNNKAPASTKPGAEPSDSPNPK
ncbi:MAG: CvpA family protein [Planctomycetota bacterium]|nr:CvpA family protein [Planctomycetota bacterium]